MNTMKSFKRSSTWDYLKNDSSVIKDVSDYTKVKFPASKFLIFQSTIVSSVLMDSRSNYLIDPLSNDFVNNNGECWSNEGLKNNYKSFIGAYACIDHPENPEKDNIGVILDAVLRKRWVDKENGKFVYYCDILVAIDRASNPEIVRNIANNNIKYMSMGCTVKYSFCSRCGFKIDYVNSYSSHYSECDHMKFSKGKRWVDNVGNERITAEILGKEADSVIFVESSVLTQPPAFSGAALSRIYPISTKAESIEINIPTSSLSRGAIKKYLLNKN